MERLLRTPTFRPNVGSNCLVLVATLATVLFGIFEINPVTAQEFRVESQTYVNASRLPVSQNVTLFSQRIAYDFKMSNDAQPKPVETLIFDSTRRLMVLLDSRRKIRLEIPEIRLLKIVDSVRKDTLQESRSSFLVNDSFEEDTDWSAGWVILKSPSITYRYQGSRPKNAEILPPYFDFLDNYARMLATDPTKIPPFARLELNNSIRRVGWMPQEIQVSVKPNALFKQGLEAKSTHTVVNQLSNLDRQRIAEAKTQWQHFEAVDLTEYRNLPENPKEHTGKLSRLANKLKPQTQAVEKIGEGQSNEGNQSGVLPTNYTQEIAPSSSPSKKEPTVKPFGFYQSGQR